MQNQKNNLNDENKKQEETRPSNVDNEKKKEIIPTEVLIRNYVDNLLKEWQEEESKTKEEAIKTPEMLSLTKGDIHLLVNKMESILLKLDEIKNSGNVEKVRNREFRNAIQELINEKQKEDRTEKDNGIGEMYTSFKPKEVVDKIHTSKNAEKINEIFENLKKEKEIIPEAKAEHDDTPKSHERISPEKDLKSKEVDETKTAKARLYSINGERFELKQEDLNKLIVDYKKRKEIDGGSATPISEFIEYEGEKEPGVLTLPSEKAKKLATKPKPTIAIDIDYLSIKLLSFSKEQKIDIMDIISFSEVTDEVLEEDLTGSKRIETLKKCIKSVSEIYDLEGREVSVSVSGKNLYTRLISILELPSSQLEDALKFELVKEHVPFSIEETQLKYKILGRNKEAVSKIDIVVFAINKKILENIVKIFSSLNISVAGIEPKSVSFCRYLRYTNQIIQGKTVAVICMGKDISEIFIVNYDNVLLCKPIKVCSETFDKAISNFLMVDGKMASKLRKKYGCALDPLTHRDYLKSPEKSFDVYEAIQPVIEQFSSELERIFNAFLQKERDKNINRIILCDEGVNLKLFKEFLGTMFTIPVSIVKPPENVEFTNKSFEEKTFIKIFPYFASTVGLALWDTLDEDEKRFNLLSKKIKKSKIKPTGRVKQKRELKIPKVSGKSLMIAAPILLILLAVGTYITLTLINKHYDENINQEKERILNLVQKDKEEKGSLEILAKIKEKKKTIEELENKRTKVALTLRELFAKGIIPKSIEIERISLENGRRLTIYGIVDNRQDIIALNENLKKTSRLSESKINSINEFHIKKSKRLRFQISCKMD